MSRRIHSLGLAGAVLLAGTLGCKGDEATTSPTSAIVHKLTWTPKPVSEDPLMRMPGTQPEQNVNLEGPGRCLNCHAGYNTQVEPGFNWKGSMMAQSARDFMFWAAMTVAGQDSIWAIGTPNAVDICERCHFPRGWLGGRSDPPNASAMTGADFDGVQCDFCHRTYDPFFQTTSDGTREGNDWAGYWDETNASSTPSQPAADTTYQEDVTQAAAVRLFNGDPFFAANKPFSTAYTENGSGQYFVSGSSQKRASFADAAARHQMLYSRFHKSRYFCGSCHDVSNPVLKNLTDPAGTDGVLGTERDPAFAYFHVERTFSEFRLSAYGRQQGGAPGIGPFAPERYTTSNPGNYIAKCQDCHMRDVSGVGCNKNGVPVRPGESTEHPKSGQPLHDLTGGNAWVSWVLASAVPGSPNYDPTNEQLLGQGPAALTLDLAQGEGLDAGALLAGSDRAKQQLQLAASIEGLTYDPNTGALSFRVQNQTGHRLISGFPEGRRMFVNVKVYASGALIREVNPYDYGVGTLKGLPRSLSSPALGSNEAYADELVYEMHPTSSLTGESETFHFVLADGRYKDNRIPPKGFDIEAAAARHAQPVWHGLPAPDYFTAAEYAGGYDAVSLTVPTGADTVVVTLYYQTTSREYVEFLRDQIKGEQNLTLPPKDGQSPYVIQTDPFFSQLKAWGDTIWGLWTHNMNVDGAKPLAMTSATWGGNGGCQAPTPTLLAAQGGHKEVTLTWSAEHEGDPSVTGYKVYYDQAGKAQLVTQVGQVTSYVDSGLSDEQRYCYKVTTLTATCESGSSNILCAITDPSAQATAGVTRIQTGRYLKSGKGKNQTVTFELTAAFTRGDEVVFQMDVADATTGQPVSGASVTVLVSGPESTEVTSNPSDSNGVAEATWKSSAPNKRGVGGTTPGSYTGTVVGVSTGGYQWDGVRASTTFTLQ